MIVRGYKIGPGANLRCANLRYADLSGADLSGADLYGANLRCADLTCADLRGANLTCANLSGANLRYADLSGANLFGANLTGANLFGANLRRADLSCANFRDITVNWLSHDLIAAILLSEALNNTNKRMVAGLILISKDWCWEKFLRLKIEPKLRKWALRVLSRYVKNGDNVPKILRKV